jgi:SnoaL-like polyketide cyclase
MNMATTIDQVTSNKTVVQRLYDLINSKDFDQFGTVIANAFVDRSNGSNGPEGMAAAAANLHRAYADLRIEPHVGQFFNLKPTNKPFEAKGINVYRVKDERIVESWLGIDPSTIRAQQLAQQELAGPAD